MAKITANNSITVPAGSTITFCEGGVGQAILDGNIYTLGMSDVFFGPFALAETIQVLVTTGPINYYTMAAPASGANMTPVFTDPLTGYTTPTSGAVFVPPTQDYLGIMIAHSAAVAAGGGTVALSGYYDLTQGGTNTTPLPRASAVSYIGTGYELIYAGMMDSANTTVRVSEGTVLDCKGVMTAFAHNNTPLTNAEADALYGPAPSDVSTANFANTGVTAAHIKNLAIKDPIFGIHEGALNRPSSFYTNYHDIAIINPSRWGCWFENFQHNNFTGISVFNAKHGQIAHVGSCQRYVAPGNSHASQLFGATPFSLPGKLTRGLVQLAYNGTTFGIDCGAIQCNKFNGQSTSQSVTFNSTATIAVTDLSFFPENMPLWFVGCSAYGFADKEIHFVLTRSAATGAGNITVATKQGNFITGAPDGFNNPTTGGAVTAKAATGSGTVANGIKSAGFPQIEVIATDTSSILFGAVRMDSEGTASTQFLFQQARGNVDLLLGTQESGNATEICLRGAAGCQLGINQGCRIDNDSASARNVIKGSRDGIGNFGIAGVYVRTDTQRAALSLSTNYGSHQMSKSMTLENRQPGGGDFTYCGTAMGQKVSGPFSNTSLSLGAGYGGCIGYSGSTAATWTLQEATSDEWVGLVHEIANYGTGTLTVNTTNSQVFNNQAGKTSYSLAPGQFLNVIAAIKPGGGFMWHVRGTNAT